MLPMSHLVMQQNIVVGPSQDKKSNKAKKVDFGHLLTISTFAV
jgi:hypothetical protein